MLQVCLYLFQATVQVYPPKPEDKKPMTRLQERLLKKLGANAYPFKFEVFTISIVVLNTITITSLKLCLVSVTCHALHWIA